MSYSRKPEVIYSIHTLLAFTSSRTCQTVMYIESEIHVRSM